MTTVAHTSFSLPSSVGSSRPVHTRQRAHKREHTRGLVGRRGVYVGLLGSVGDRLTALRCCAAVCPAARPRIPTCFTAKDVDALHRNAVSDPGMKVGALTLEARLLHTPRAA